MQHLAVVMDGNRRWARKHGFDAWLGHKKGVETAQMVIDYCLQRKISYLSLYTFSLENLKRSQQEREYIFGPLANEIEKAVPDYIKYGIRVKFVGDRKSFPEQLIKRISDSEEKTAHCSNLFLQILFCYGGQQEIVAAAKQIAQDVLAGKQDIDLFCEDVFAQYLWMHGVPSPDLVVRTGGMKRLSNFLLYHIAYSEIRFLDCLWPEFTRANLEAVIQDFDQTRRSFGI